MPDRGKPFIVYRRSNASFTIVPRGPLGWTQFSAWMALLGLLVFWFVGHVDAKASTPDYASGVALFCMGLLGWAVCGIWWMLARSEVIDVSVLERDRKQAQRRRGRND